MNVLVTGASGTLGRPLAVALRSSGADVIGLSRRERADGDGVRWVHGDLRTGAGLDAAVSGADVLVHAATDAGASEGKVRMRYAVFHPRRTDVGGTQRLMDAARAMNVSHFVYVSIVGVDRVPYEYFRIKLEAERIVAESGVPYTIARTSQFHTFVDSLLRITMRSPMPMIVRGLRVQPIDPGDAAAAIARIALGPPANGIVDIGGPEVITSGAAADAWLAARGSRRRVRSMPAIGRFARAAEAGGLLTEDRTGTITWQTWVDTHLREKR